MTKAEMLEALDTLEDNDEIILVEGDGKLQGICSGWEIAQALIDDNPLPQTVLVLHRSHEYDEVDVRHEVKKEKPKLN